MGNKSLAVAVCVPIKDNDENVIGILANSHRLVDHIPDILYLYSNQKGFQFFSPSVRNILGYTPEELYKKPSFFRDSIHREDQVIVSKALDEVVNQGRFDIEYRIVDKNGDCRWFSDRAIGCHIQDNEVIIEGLAVDITKRKLAENALNESVREYNDMVAQIPVGIFKYRVKAKDEIAVRKIVSIMLERLGFTVLEAGDGVEALDMFRQNKDTIRLVVSDLTMPRMDGWGLLDAIRSIVPGIPVILTSGYNQNHVMNGDHKEQPQSFLSKPYRSDDLREAIVHALNPLG
ncbi:MAG: PAS domain-containing protein [Desulfobacteraceae bacterium]